VPDIVLECSVCQALGRPSEVAIEGVRLVVDVGIEQRFFGLERGLSRPSLLVLPVLFLLVEHLPLLSFVLGALAHGYRAVT